ncbi:glycosyltransferase family 2 protein [Peribacillus kribbensis]|uniref:glycosyltransferase family 2 protein n=1 Tax=Peribacillus kribbensis TaxID=356658 RepID=UPI0004000695|nr:glycosyltransferase family 2 protein [Peribacillus kribbensis]
MNQEPLISIITVCYNSKLTIERTFKSILNQSYRNLEYIVIDGNSTDGTAGLVKQYQEVFENNGITYKWISEPDNGIYDAMNKGIASAQGELIGIINSDDYYEESALRIIAQEYSKDNSYDVYHGLLKYHDSGKLSMIKGAVSDVLPRHMIEHPTCFLKKETYKQYGVFNCKYKYVADYELLCRIRKNGGKFKLIDKVIANFYDGGAGNTFKSVVEALKLRYEYQFINRKEYIIRYFKLRLGRTISRLIN